MELEVSSRRVGPNAIVAAAGEIDLTSCVRLRDLLDTVESSDADAIVVDLSEVGFIDSTGLSVLVDGARHARTIDRSFGVVADGHLRELLRITGLDTVMAVHPRLADAVPEPASAGPVVSPSGPGSHLGNDPHIEGAPLA